MTHLLLTNNGEFLALGAPNSSNYNGYFVKTDTYWKTLWNILPTSGAACTHTTKNSRTFADGSTQTFSVSECLHATLNGSFTLTLDCKQLYDETDEDRVYDISTQGNETHIRFKELYMILATSLAVTTTGTWTKTNYAYDDKRGSASNTWVYEALTLKGEGEFRFAVGTSENSARAHLTTGLQRTCTGSPAWTALCALRTETGILAGLPWFHQEWSRDELIALGGFLHAKDHAFVTQMLDKWYNAVQDGKLPAIYPAAGLTSIDAPGWLGKRTIDLIRALLKKEQPLPEQLPVWREHAKALLDNAPVRDNLVWNDRNETWMDTASNDTGRKGACIEIQALYTTLADAYALMCALTNTQPMEHTLDVSRFVQGEKLLDCIHDDGTPDQTTRPNIFLAWYACPGLFTKKQWSTFFASALADLWLPWGGLASISKDDDRFHAWYTGEDVASYHRGDSWYFVNNIAAIAMKKVDAKRFKKYITAIIQASKQDMHLGFVGHCSEISSAAQQEPCGCWAQAWSASTLLELTR
ncbi:MAG: hypothetical protein OXR66_07840 [Candidatus Woesearchaeota archaeon]|nr:hypothetical protein [Candidatus Woesearchaeota archaeon]